MGFLNRDEVFAKFQRLGRNSSHFVWFLCGLRFYETLGGFVFGFLEVRDVTLIALEPLMPLGHGDFPSAWREFREAVRPKVAFFISVYAPFAKTLREQGFKTIKVGREPWVRLDDCIPRGNAGKGVRSGRNQAIKAGLQVEEWSPEEILASGEKRQTLERLLRDWRNRRLLELPGFLNQVDPFQYVECRRYFVARSPDRGVEAFLVATPVPAMQSYFLEDLIIRDDAAKGSGELLTLEAMVRLAESGAKQASLGVVSMTRVDSGPRDGFPRAIRLLLHTVPNWLKKIYRSEGLEIFRKRFKPHTWDEIHLALWRSPESGISETRAWLRGLLALGLAFQPGVRFSFRWFARFVTAPLRTYPVTIVMTLVPFILFAKINHFGDLPAWALTKYGFTGSAPFREWLMRSIVSDYLYFNPQHILVWGALYSAIIAWAEKSHRLRFLIPTLVLASVFDDLVNYAVIVAPFNYFHPVLFQNLIAVKDVGGSLGLVFLLGIQLCEIRRHREILFTAIALAAVFGFAFSSQHLHALVLNLNHFLFLSLGYMIGKIHFEIERAKSRRMAKGKSPLGKSVLGSSRPESTLA